MIVIHTGAEVQRATYTRPRGVGGRRTASNLSICIKEDTLKLPICVEKRILLEAKLLCFIFWIILFLVNVGGNCIISMYNGVEQNYRMERNKEEFMSEKETSGWLIFW